MTKIRLKHVNKFTDRHGKRRYYFRRPGLKAVPLPGEPDSLEFMDALHAAQATMPGNVVGAGRTVAGTINALCVAYYKHTAFTDDLAVATQKMRRPIIESFRADHGDRPAARVQRVHIDKLLSGKKSNAQKNWLKAIRPLFAFAVSQSICAVNPTDGAKASKGRKSEGHLTWQDEQIAMYRQYHTLGTMPRLALELLLNIAARRGDAHWLGHQHISKGRLCWRPGKTRRTTGKSLEIGIIPDLRAALDAMPPNGELSFLLQGYGKPFASAAAFGNKFAEWCVAAGLKPVLCDDGKIRNYRAHGLRKAALTELAYAGCTGAELMNVSGHSSLAQVQVYIDKANQRRLADNAMDKRLAAGGKRETETYKPYDPKLQTLA